MSLWNALKQNIRCTWMSSAFAQDITLELYLSVQTLHPQDNILRMLIKLWNLRLQFRWAIREWERRRTEIEIKR